MFVQLQKMLPPQEDSKSTLAQEPYTSQPLLPGSIKIQVHSFESNHQSIIK